MSKQPNLTRLPFDQYSRQKIASDIIQSLRKPDQTFSILDVGGYKGATHLFHPKDKVKVLDVFDVDEKDYIKGDATAMDFATDAFDFVVSFDVFEHIPRDRRELFVAECTRVAKRGVIIAAPTGTPQNASAEVHLNNVFRVLHNKDHEWLKEHIDYRLPGLGLTEKLLQKNKLHTLAFPSNYLPAWLLMQTAIFAASRTDKVGHKMEQLYETYNTLLCPDGVGELAENYRLVTVGFANPADAKAVQKNTKQFVADSKGKFSNTVSLTEKVGGILTAALGEFASQVEELTAQMKTMDDTLVNRAREVKALQDQVAEIKGSRTYRLAAKLGSPKRLAKKIFKK